MVAEVAHANDGSGSAFEQERPLGVDRGDSGKHENRREDLQASGNPTIHDGECHPLTSDECLMGVYSRSKSSPQHPLVTLGNINEHSKFKISIRNGMS